VQAVHDQNDRTAQLVVEAAVAGVVVPLVRRLALRLRQCFNGSSMTIKSAPRPVKTPPTEVATRQPWAVVSNSGTT
jgi:hypothetical protein